MPQDLTDVVLLKGYRFRIDFNDDCAVYANEVSGLDAEFDVAEYRAGDDVLFTVRKYPGLAKYGNITIKQCLIADELGFYNTVGDYLEGSVDHSSDKKDLTITLMNDSGEDAAVWTVSSAWVTKYTGPDLNSTSSDISIETIEIAHEGLRRTR